MEKLHLSGSMTAFIILVVFTVLWFSLVPLGIKYALASQPAVNLTDGTVYTPPAPMISPTIAGLFLYSIPSLLWLAFGITMIVKTVRNMGG